VWCVAASRNSVMTSSRRSLWLRARAPPAPEGPPPGAIAQPPRDEVCRHKNHARDFRSSPHLSRDRLRTAEPLSVPGRSRPLPRPQSAQLAERPPHPRRRGSGRAEERVWERRPERAMVSGPRGASRDSPAMLNLAHPLLRPRARRIPHLEGWKTTPPRPEPRAETDPRIFGSFPTLDRQRGSPGRPPRSPRARPRRRSPRMRRPPRTRKTRRPR